MLPKREIQKGRGEGKIERCQVLRKREYSKGRKRGSGKGARGNPRFILADCDSGTGTSSTI